MAGPQSALHRDEAHNPLDEPPVETVRAMAVLGLIFGTLGLCALPFGLIWFYKGAIEGDADIYLFESTVRHTSGNVLWLAFSSVVGVGLSLLLLVSSVGAMSLKRWGRVGLLLYSIGSIVLGVIGSVFYLRWLASPWREQFAQVRGDIPDLVVFGGWGIGLALATALLIVLNQRAVKAAFTE